VQNTHYININTDESGHSETGPVRQNPIHRTVRTAHLSVLITVHNFSTQYSTDSSYNLPSYLQTTIIAQMLSLRGEGVVNQVIILFISLVTIKKPSLCGVKDSATQWGPYHSVIVPQLIRKLCNACDTTKMLGWLRLSEHEKPQKSVLASISNAITLNSLRQFFEPRGPIFEKSYDELTENLWKSLTCEKLSMSMWLSKNLAKILWKT